MFLIKQRDNASNEEKEEESSDHSEAASDASDNEDSENTEQPQIPAEETHKTGVESCDVKRNTADISTEGDSDELKSSSVPDQQSGEEIETVNVGAKSQLLGDHGIFGRSRAHQEKRAGPMITEIVMDTGKLTVEYM